MAEGSSSSRKRPLMDDDDSSNKRPSQEKRIRYPKGKKFKQGDYVTDDLPDVPTRKDVQLAANMRAMLRKRVPKEQLDEEFEVDIGKAEVYYEDDETFAEEGINIEQFNLTKEREEGYFDENGNYVEYLKDEVKDAWLDSVDSISNFAQKSSVPASNAEEPRDLTSEELARINRRIADVLQPGEKVLQGLRRLKGTSTDKKQKMSAETKILFDQLTEDAMKLMDNGDYDVYDERQEKFQREAEGYEKLVQVRSQGISMSLTAGTSTDDAFDIFADDDASAAANPVSEGGESVGVQSYQGGDLQSDYVYDESTGYYYSSSLGYYYDPSSGLYGSIASGKWYSYNEKSGQYDEVLQQQPTATEN